jgi:hypothetical protein
MPVSVTVLRSCGIRVAPEARPRALCRPGTAVAVAVGRDDLALRYTGPIDPVSVVRQAGKGQAFDVLVITF